MMEIKITGKQLKAAKCPIVFVDTYQFGILFDYRTVSHYTMDAYGFRNVYCLEHRVYLAFKDTAYVTARLHDFPSIEKKYIALDKALQAEVNTAEGEDIPYKVMLARYNLTKDLFEALYGKNSVFTFF
jgi:hypothetical protein